MHTRAIVWGLTAAVVLLVGATAHADAVRRTVGTDFVWPATGQIVTPPIVYRVVPGTVPPARAVRIATQGGASVIAAADGRVALAALPPGSLTGRSPIVLDHGSGYQTSYAGIERRLVSPGAKVKRSQPIATAGDALTFEVCRYGARIHVPASFGAQVRAGDALRLFTPRRKSVP